VHGLGSGRGIRCVEVRASVFGAAFGLVIVGFVVSCGGGSDSPSAPAAGSSGYAGTIAAPASSGESGGGGGSAGSSGSRGAGGSAGGVDGGMESGVAGEAGLGGTGDSGPTATGAVRLVIGIVPPATAGTLRLSSQGFIVQQRSCAGSLCVRGSPAGLGKVFPE
jgi:hypothetical protein